MDPKISGSYTTTRDGGISYAYDAFWTESGRTVLWDAKVRHEGNLVGSPSGTLEDVPRGSEIAPLVRAAISTAIEDRSGITAPR